MLIEKELTKFFNDQEIKCFMDLSRFERSHINFDGRTYYKLDNLHRTSKKFNLQLMILRSFIIDFGDSIEIIFKLITDCGPLFSNLMWDLDKIEYNEVYQFTSRRFEEDWD